MNDTANEVNIHHDVSSYAATLLHETSHTYPLFTSLSPNSLDAVSDRDFIAEFLFFASMLTVHVSQIAEDLILYSHKKFITLADAYSTGSSLMPQKKNPDAAELLRGKAGRFIGAMNSILIVLKSLPRAYNKDLQEDKSQLFELVAMLHSILRITTGMISTIKVHGDVMYAALDRDVNMLATDLADYLVRKGVPFRQTHHVAGAAVKLTEDLNKERNSTDKEITLRDLTVSQYKSLHPLFEADVLDNLSWEKSVEQRTADGGTAKVAVEKQIKQARTWLQNFLQSVTQKQ
jgi:argininosuccinate lyase